MCVAGVMFGRADLPQEYGVVINQDDTPGSFAHAVYSLAQQETSARALPCEPAADGKERLRLINPRIYVDDIHAVPLKISGDDKNSTIRKVVVTNTASALFANRLTNALEPLDQKVVFFGAGYGTDDTFMTPVGELYGVE